MNTGTEREAREGTCKVGHHRRICDGDIIAHEESAEGEIRIRELTCTLKISTCTESGCIFEPFIDLLKTVNSG